MIDSAAASISAASECFEMAWAKPLYKRDKVNEAARAVLAYDPLEIFESEKYHAYLVALPIVDNWRASHNYPLNTFQITLRRYAQDVSPDRAPPLIAQRIKRLRSIELKLRLKPKMKLTQMQDIGGVRAVVRSIAEVREVAQRYILSNLKHEAASLDDYIQTPRDSGYRGIHFVYRYFSDKNKTEYNDLKIEIQLRSQYQHAWATAVETVGMFTRQALKSSIGEPDWLRFFQLMSTAIARREHSPPVPNTPTELHELREEIRSYATSLDVVNKLNAFRNLLRIGTEQPGLKDARLFLLVLDPTQDKLTITPFKESERQLASQSYLEAEKIVRENRKTDAVLVQVDSPAALRRAYQNYFADTRLFLQLLEQVLSGKSKRILTPTTVASL